MRRVVHGQVVAEEPEHREAGGRGHEDPLHSADMAGRRDVQRVPVLARGERADGQTVEEALVQAHGDRPSSSRLETVPRRTG